MNHLVFKGFCAIFLMVLTAAIECTAQSNSIDDGESETCSWGYENTEEWGNISPQCNGIHQSPIHLQTSNSLVTPIPAIRFVNYDIPFSAPATVTNNGHSISMQIPPIRNGRKPFITGGLMHNIYEAQSLHFHWNSKGLNGSEHQINGRKLDMEMHIVHKNVAYDTEEEALKYKDGLAVLGIMLTIVDNPNRFYKGLNQLFNVLPLLREYTSETTINGQLTLGQFLGDLSTRNFFTYSGSLTTPPCAEAVIWTVFPEALPVAYSQARQFWNILDSTYKPLVNNVRPLQERNHRQVLYRSTAVVI